MKIWRSFKRLVRKLTPHYFSRIDDWLITRSPLLWTGCLHYVLFYSLLATTVFAFVLVAMPIEYARGDSGTALIWLALALSVVGLLGWAYYQASYSILKNHGQHSRFFHFHYALMYFVCGLVIAIPTATAHGIIYYRSLTSYISVSDLIPRLLGELQKEYLPFLMAVLFILALYHSMKSLFGAKVFFIGFIAFYVVIWPILGIIVAVYNSIEKAFELQLLDQLNEILILLGLLLSAGLLLYLLRLNSRTTRAVILWQFMVYTFISTIILLSEFNDYSYLFVFLLLYFIFLPWQRSVLYKIYVLPKVV